MPSSCGQCGPVDRQTDRQTGNPDGEGDAGEDTALERGSPGLKRERTELSRRTVKEGAAMVPPASPFSGGRKAFGLGLTSYWLLFCL